MLLIHKRSVIVLSTVRSKNEIPVFDRGLIHCHKMQEKLSRKSVPKCDISYRQKIKVSVVKYKQIL